MGTDETETIVVGIDSSAGARRALDWGLEEARRRGGRCHIVHAWEYPAMAMASPYMLIEGLEQFHADEGAWLSGVLDQLDTTGVVVTSQLIHGPAGPTLVEAATAHHATLLVVGSVGHGAILGTLLGSVTQYCLRHASSPVVVIPPHAAIAPEPAASPVTASSR